jgi:hypothetical protein
MHSFGMYLVGTLLGIGIGSLCTYLLLTTTSRRTNTNKRTYAQSPNSVHTAGKFALKYDPGLVASFIAPEQFSPAFRVSQSNATSSSTQTEPNLNRHPSANRPDKGDNHISITSPNTSSEGEPVSYANTDLTQWIGSLSSMRDNIEKEEESTAPLPNGFRG